MFYETEIALREQLKYPPFCDIIVISFNSTDENEIKNVSGQVYEYLEQNLNNNFQEVQTQNTNIYKIFMPMPAPIDKIQNRYRWRIIVKGNMTIEANEVLNKCLKDIYQKDLKTTRVSIDVNPNNMS